MIPGWLISIVTFPGVIVHELAHLIFCNLFHVPVHKVCYFRFGNPAGFVIHDPPPTAGVNIWVSVGPFLVNTLIGAMLAVLHAIPAFHLAANPVSHYGLLWLAISITMHSFPSTGDASTLWRALWSERGSFLSRIIGTPIVVVIYLGAIGSAIWLDLVYGIIVVGGVQHWVSQVMSR